MPIEKKVFNCNCINIFYSLYLVSQDLLQKATELKLRLHMQSKNDKSLITQHSFDHSNSIHNQMYEDRPKLVDANPRKSMINLSSTINLKEKPRIPIIRDRSVPNPTAIRRTTIVEQNNIDIKKTKMKSCEEKYRKTIKKRRKIKFQF
jgi:hypothetical protein